MWLGSINENLNDGPTVKDYIDVKVETQAILVMSKLSSLTVSFEKLSQVSSSLQGIVKKIFFKTCGFKFSKDVKACNVKTETSIQNLTKEVAKIKTQSDIILKILKFATFVAFVGSLIVGGFLRNIMSG